MITTLLSGLIGAGPTMTPRGGAPFAAVQASTTRWVATNADSVMTTMYSQAAANASPAPASSPESVWRGTLPLRASATARDRR